jgi:DNA-binding response OmpR family regulator
MYLTDLLRYALTQEGYKVQVAGSATAALAAAVTNQPDLIILDALLPDGDGFALCARFRMALHIPVIMLTARQSIEETLTGFERGADDYVTKPFTMQILMRRVQVVLRRCPPGVAPAQRASQLYRLGSGTFDAHTFELRGPQGISKLTRSEGRILQQLVLHQGQILSAEQILERVWGHETESTASVVKTHIRHIRERLHATTGAAEILTTVRGLGYTIRASQSGPTDCLHPCRQVEPAALQARDGAGSVVRAKENSEESSVSRGNNTPPLGSATSPSTERVLAAVHP